MLKPNTQHNQPKPIFIIGSYRSGTSILTWCLGQHPNILPLEETHWIARQSVDLNYLYRLGIKQKNHSSLGLMKISKKKFYQYYGVMIDQFIIQSKSRLIDNGTKLLHSYNLISDSSYSMQRSQKDPKSRWIDGTPENSHYIFGLYRLFPEAKFIHILRNPAEVATSLMHFSSAGGRDYIEVEAYLAWMRLVSACVQAEKALGNNRLLRVYYEDLLDRPEYVMRSCLDFINEPYHPDCLLPLKHKINSSINKPNSNNGIKYPSAIQAIEYFETLRTQSQFGICLSELRKLAKNFYNYCETQTPEHIKNLSDWALDLDRENKKKENQINALQNQLRAISKPMRLLAYGPEKIIANQAFNEQPNGESAIWATTENATPETILILNDTALESSPHPDGKVVTAIVPRSLYSQPGKYQLFLRDNSTGLESNHIALEILN